MSATITALPTPPSRTAPSTFSARADALLGALPTFVNEANALAAEVEAAALALASPGLSATSTTSLAVAIGTKSLTVQAGKSFVAGMSVKIANTSSPTIWMHGDVITYDAVSGSLVVEVSLVVGSGTYATWTISLSAPLIDNTEFASPTKMYFYQDTAPVGWTIDAAAADCCLAVKGGSNAYNVAGGNKAGAWAMTTAQMPVHAHANTASGSGSGSTNEAGTHQHNVGFSPTADSGNGFIRGGSSFSAWSYQGTDWTANHSHTVSTALSISVSNANAGSGESTYRPYSAVGIIATKDA